MAAERGQADVYVETGLKRVVAAAIEWPGWCRTGKDEVGALAALVQSAPRYSDMMRRSGLAFEPPGDAAQLAIRERVVGSSATDMGVPEVILACGCQAVERCRTGTPEPHPAGVLGCV